MDQLHTRIPQKPLETEWFKNQDNYLQISQIFRMFFAIPSHFCHLFDGADELCHRLLGGGSDPHPMVPWSQAAAAFWPSAIKGFHFLTKNLGDLLDLQKLQSSNPEKPLHLENCVFRDF